jgi:hypothetical protein
MVMHDWWLGLLAAAFGKIGYLEDRTILYRQHGRNEIGASDVCTVRFKLSMFMHGGEIHRILNETYRQAEAFLNMYSKKLGPDQLELLSIYSSVSNMNKWKRRVTVCKLGTLKYGLSRKTGQLLFI